MMSNFRARSSSLRSLLRAAILTISIAAIGGAWASDAPAPAVPPPVAPAQLKATKAMPAVQRVKIENVSARAIASSDAMISTLLTESDKSALREPILISVQVAEPFTNLERNASPVIVINGQTLGDSVVPFQERNRIVAIMRDGTRLDQTIRVQVGWLGDFDRTLSEPVQAQLTR
jgi:hypothetical protein